MTKQLEARCRPSFMLKEFRAFIMRGNVLDLAVAVVIGAAFGKIIDSLVKDVLMPVIGMVLGKVDFTQLYILIKAGKSGATEYPSLDAATKDGASVMAYGNFINNIVTFVIIAFCVFLIVKAINAMSKKKVEEPAAAEPTPSEALLTEIRDLLKQKA